MIFLIRLYYLNISLTILLLSITLITIICSKSFAQDDYRYGSLVNKKQNPLIKGVHKLGSAIQLSKKSGHLNMLDCEPDLETLSDYGENIINAISVPSVLENSTVSKKLLLTSCNKLDRILIDGPEIFSAMREEISKAEHEVNIAF